MKILRGAGIVLATLVVLAGVAYLNRAWIVLKVGKWTQPHIAENMPVTWQQGPATAAQPPGKRPPNIVFILVDDMGFNDITFNGGGVANGAVPTPNIDAIGRQGVNLENGYAGNATCAPSRAAIMTGRYPQRFGFEFTPTPVGFSRLVGTFKTPGSTHPPRFNRELVKDNPKNVDDEAVPSNEVTIAEMLKAQGYHTLHFGKWHLGGKKGTRPEDQGFDESLGFIAGASMYLPENDPNVENSKQDFDPIDKFLWANLPYMVQYNGGPRFKPNAYMTDYLTNEAIKAIGANRNRPFFMYLAYNGIHTPLQATKADYDALPQIKDHRLRVYAAMIRNLDRNIGRVMAELKAQGLDDNTLVIFTSDNGGANYIGLPDINRPYRGWKASFFEGGVHVPFFLRWPAVLKAGERYAYPAGHVDIFATAAGAAGAKVPADRVIDGVNLIPYLTGLSKDRPHQALFWRSGAYKMIRVGDWKLQVLPDPNKVWLFDLSKDPTEKVNLAAANPAKVAELMAELKRQDAQMAKSSWPSLLQGPIPIDHPLGVPDKPGDEYIYWNN
ncbi:arylsulfatase A-like enzyme [Caulobacter ginsengisoli]|uniref:Arylsulfatase A-like enzyme n=1 Tax=Caulobacter ginsengisoli TaxID=400775 RepID=A0ABU0ISJ1_9CAUL|nr:sulfatase-like hydrolase/transferase [Caulobacter ginsengisoli]MDQ0464959.1 arylsulfatase A-like enzyme [Caulobacter ginsengisoli]